MAYTFAGQYGPDSFYEASGRALALVDVTVLNLDGTEATLWADREKTTLASNPVTTDALGNLTILADPGDYDLSFEGTQVYVRVAVPVDPQDAIERGGIGVIGPQGPAATVAVGTVTTGAAGSSAAVSNAGTTSAAVFNFTIPKGDKGDQGDQGIQGPGPDPADIQNLFDALASETSARISAVSAEATARTSGDAAKIDKSIGTAKGSLITFTASGTPVEQAVGTNGFVLVADSTQTNGIKWAAASSTPADADATTKGIVKLANDLGGTAALPTVVATHLASALPIAQGGTAGTTQATARSGLGLVIGTDVEAHDPDLTTIAGLSPTNDDFLQRKSSAWTNRTPAQVKTDLSLPSDTTASLALKANLASPDFSGTPTVGGIALTFTSGTSVNGQVPVAGGFGPVWQNPSAYGAEPGQWGLLASSVPPNALWNTGAGQTSGTVQWIKVPLPVSITITNICVYVLSAGVTLTSGQNLAAVYSVSGTTATRLGITSDQSAVWNSAGWKVMPLSGGTAAGGGGPGSFLYVALLAVGTTTPAFARGSGAAASVSGVNNLNTSAASGNLCSGNGSTSQTTLPSSQNLTSLTAAQFYPFVGLS